MSYCNKNKKYDNISFKNTNKMEIQLSGTWIGNVEMPAFGRAENTSISQLKFTSNTTELTLENAQGSFTMNYTYFLNIMTLLFEILWFVVPAILVGLAIEHWFWNPLAERTGVLGLDAERVVPHRPQQPPAGRRRCGGGSAAIRATWTLSTR